MRMIFCNVTYLRYYDGRVIGEIKPKTGGRWVRENEDAHEKWNFLNVDGECYGYVQGNSDVMHIEKLDKVYKQQDEADDVIVIWCALNESNKTVIVGWYEHATVYRKIQDMKITPVSGLDRSFWFKTKAENAYLLPEDARVFEVGRASKTGAGTGFGQQNYWYAESDYANEILKPNVMKFIEENRFKRINTLNTSFIEPELLLPLTNEELERMEEMGDDEDMEYLSYAYRLYSSEPSADNAYKIAVTLRNLFQYKKAIPWYEKTIELDPTDWETMGILTYMYSQVEEYDKCIQSAFNVLTHEKSNEQDIKDEIYCILADSYFMKGDVSEAISWQNRILNESHNNELIKHTLNVQSEWKSF